MNKSYYLKPNTHGRFDRMSLDYLIEFTQTFGNNDLSNINHGCSRKDGNKYYFDNAYREKILEQYDLEF